MPWYHSFIKYTVGALALTSTCFAMAADLEKEELKFGFIKLTDMAPLAIAYEKGYFEDLVRRSTLYYPRYRAARWRD